MYYKIKVKNTMKEEGAEYDTYSMENRHLS